MIKAIMLWLAGPRLILGILWLSFLGLGSFWMEKHPKSLVPRLPARVTGANPCSPNDIKRARDHFSSLRDMVVNHRILETDLNWGEQSGQRLDRNLFLGKYLACPVRAGDPLVLEELWALPLVRPSAGKSAYLLPLANHAGLESNLDVSSQIELFENAKPLLRQVPVLAVQCDPVGPPNCIAVLDLSASDGQLLSRVDTTKLQIVRSRP